MHEEEDEEAEQNEEEHYVGGGEGGGGVGGGACISFHGQKVFFSHNERQEMYFDHVFCTENWILVVIKFVDLVSGSDLNSANGHIFLSVFSDSENHRGSGLLRAIHPLLLRGAPQRSLPHQKT